MYYRGYRFTRHTTKVGRSSDDTKQPILLFMRLRGAVHIDPDQERGGAEGMPGTATRARRSRVDILIRWCVQLDYRFTKIMVRPLLVGFRIMIPTVTI